MQIDRLIQIIFLLISREQVTAQQLADYFNVSTRTIYRDINTLSCAGIPIYSSQGHGGGIGIMKEYAIDKSMFSAEEQKNIIHGLQVLQAANYPDTEKALNKVGALFKKNFHHNWLEVDFSFWGSSGRERVKFVNLEKAILDKYVIMFEYFSSELKQSTRIVEPLRLLFKEQAWYIQGYCRKQQEIRLFRLSRMRELKITGEVFHREIPGDLPVEPDYSGSYELLWFKLKFQREIAHRVYDEYEEKEITVCDDNSFLVTTRYPMNEWLVRHILSFGKYVTVLEPECARDLIKERAQEIVNLYQ